MDPLSFENAERKKEKKAKRQGKSTLLKKKKEYITLQITILVHVIKFYLFKMVSNKTAIADAIDARAR